MNWKNIDEKYGTVIGYSIVLIPLLTFSVYIDALNVYTIAIILLLAIAINAGLWYLAIIFVPSEFKKHYRLRNYILTIALLSLLLLLIFKQFSLAIISIIVVISFLIYKLIQIKIKK